MARWFRFGLSVAGPFVCRCLNIRPMLRFHLPLIKPDVRFSRIRLPDKDSHVRPRKVACSTTELDKAQLLMQESVVKS